MHRNYDVAKSALLWIAVLFLLSATVSAIGVSPIRKVVDFEPNGEYDLELKIRSSAESDIRALVYARGELSEYIGIQDSLVSISQGEESKIARYKLTLPESFERPGVHKSELVVTEYPSSFGTDDGTIVSATASVVTELWVRVLYPGKYAEAQLYSDAKNPGEPVQFAISVMNFGSQDIAKAHARIKILGATYEEIAVIETNEVSIPSKQQKKLTASWPAQVNPGKYHVVAEIIYDDKRLVVEDDVTVGDLYIDIKRIDVKDFTLGDVAAFDIFLESKWNEQIDDVYGEMIITDAQGTEYTRFKTATTSIPAMGLGVLKAYWDTEGILVGNYDIRLLIHYAQRVTEKIVQAEVNIGSIRTDLGITAQVVASPTTGRESVLTVLVAVLILINLGWFIYFVRSKRGGSTK